MDCHASYEARNDSTLLSTSQVIAGNNIRLGNGVIHSKRSEKCYYQNLIINYQKN